jgi:hypothetical protein
LTDGSANLVWLTGTQDFSRGAMNSDTDIYVHLERTYYTTQTDITVDLLVDDPSDAGQYGSDPGDETLASGAYVHVYFVHMDVNNSTTHTNAGSITFDEQIVAIIGRRTNLDDTDNSLGEPNSTYTPTPPYRGFWENDDVLTISSDLRTITIDSIHVNSGNPADQFRVLVRVPEPGTAVTGAVFALAALMIRRPRRPVGGNRLRRA